MKMPGGVNSGAKFTANDYMSFGAMRGVADGSYTFGAKMIIANVKGEALNNSLYFAGDADKPQRVKLDDLKDRYVMFVQTFTAEKQSLWVDGKMIYSCKSRYPNQAQMGLTMSAHKYMILNAFVAGETLDENAIDLYGKYGIRLMYATGYAYAADEKAIATFFDYYFVCRVVSILKHKSVFVGSKQIEIRIVSAICTANRVTVYLYLRKRVKILNVSNVPFIICTCLVIGVCKFKP